MVRSAPRPAIAARPDRAIVRRPGPRVTASPRRPRRAPRFFQPLGPAALIRAGLIGATPGALFWPALLPLVRYLAADR